MWLFLKTLAELGPQPPRVESETDRALHRTHLLYQQGHTDEAIIICREILDRFPGHPVAWNNLGYGLGCSGFITKALRCYEKALELWPEYPEAWNNKAVVMLDLGGFEEALECSTRAVKLNPKGVMRLWNKAAALKRLSRLDESLASLRMALALNPTSDAIAEEYGEIFDWRVSVLEDLRSATGELRSNPKDADAWISKGFSLRNLGRQEESISCFDRALKLEPSAASAWYFKGRSLGELKRFEPAIHHFDRAFELGLPGSPWTQSSRWLQRGLCRAGLGDPARALNSYKRAMEIEPRHDTVWFHRGLAEEEMGHLERGKASYRWGVEQKIAKYIGQEEYARERLVTLEGVKLLPEHAGVAAPL